MDAISFIASPRDSASPSDVEDRIQHIDQSLRREIARQAERAQRAALEALDARVAPIRQEVLAVKEEVANFLGGGSSGRGLSSVHAGEADLSAREAMDHVGPLPALAHLAIPRMARLSSEVWDAVDESDVLDKAFLEALDQRSKDEDTPRRRTFAGDSACPEPADQMGYACPNPEDAFEADSPIPHIPSDCGFEDVAPYDEELDATAATDKDLDLLETRVLAALGSHTDRTAVFVNALEAKHSRAWADLEAKLTKLDAAQQALSATLDAKLSLELERIAAENRYGRSMAATALEEQQEDLRSEFQNVHDQLRGDHAAAHESLSADLRSEFRSVHDQLRCDHAAAHESLSADLRNEFRSVHGQLRSDHAAAHESLSASFKAELEGAMARASAAQKGLQDAQDQRYDLRFEKVVADQLEGRQRLEKSVAECRFELKTLGERLGKQLGEVEAKAIEGFPRKCAEHRESHFKALEAVMREESDSKRARLENKLLAEIDRRLRVPADATGRKQEARQGCPDAGG